MGERKIMDSSNATKLVPGFLGVPGEVICACRKHFFIPKRPNQKWASTKCRDDCRNAARWEASKKALELSHLIIELLTPKNGSK